jgi:poly-beta-1,6-N-acetyl-D-glucosamine synthase
LHLPFLLWCVTALLIVWVLVGYPVWVIARARSRGRAIAADPTHTPTVTAMIAVRNGETWIGEKVASIFAQDYPAAKLSVLVISDGSTDRTEAICESLQRGDVAVRVVRQKAAGKAAALTRGMAMLTSDVVVLTDARQMLDRRAIRELVAPLADPTVGAVSGVLLPPQQGDLSDQTAGVYWGMETRLRIALGTLDSMLGATGPLYAMRVADLRPVPDGLILDDMYLPLGAFFNGKRLITAPDAKAYEQPMPLDAEFRRKVRTAAGNYQLLQHEPRLLQPSQNRMFGHFLSYKIGRLLLPHLVLLEFALAWLLPQPFSAVIVALHGLALVLALVDGRVPAHSTMRRVTAPIRSFAALLAAAFMSQRIFFKGTGGLWIPTQTQR